MTPSQKDARKLDWGGTMVPTIQLDSSDITGIDPFFETGAMSFLSQETMGDENIKIKALNLAISMSRLFSNVKVEDVINLAKKLSTYIKFNK